MTEWATYYDEIPDALENNTDLREHALDLVPVEPIRGKSIEGREREDKFRAILEDFFSGEITHDIAEQRISRELPARESPHYGDNRVFNDQWEERLLRSQTSRFYNQAVLEILQSEGVEVCHVPHSPRQYPDSECTEQLAGESHPVEELLGTLHSQQREGKWDEGVTIPGHANCTHTVVPPDDI